MQYARVVMVGGTAKMVPYHDGVLVADLVKAAGGTIGPNQAVALDGKRATPSTPVRPGSTVSLQPMDDHG